MYLFDIDGTLLLTGGAGSRAINQIFLESHGVEGVMNSVSAGGKTDEMIIQECAREHLQRDLSEEELADVLAEYVPRMEVELSRADGFHLMPHVRECLRFLADCQETLGIATGNIEATALAKLEHAGLREHFRFGGYGSDSPVRSELVAKAISRGMAVSEHRLVAAHFVVVGDTLHDIEAARACGARVIAVATGSVSKEKLVAAQPDACLDTLEELPAWHGSHFRAV